MRNNFRLINCEKMRQELKAKEAKAVMGGNAKIMKAIQERNRPIAHCYFKGKIMGQHYAWLESNLVFEVAHFKTLMSN